MLKTKQHIFYFTIFSLLGFTYNLQGMEGLGTPDELISLDAALARQIAAFGIGACVPGEQTKINKKRKRDAKDNKIDIPLEIHPENQNPSYEELIKAKRRRIAERRKRRISAGGSHLSEHPLIEAIAHIHSQPSLAQNYYSKALHFLKNHHISQDILGQAFRMAISRGIEGIAYEIYDPQDPTRSLL